ncbi:hypothetical protein CONCODRAFT_12252 [Conidiobolus coronatus NRRL 28638]|uniref:Helix-turn-helix type 11 domain-containing protein n=1 Tax=Conidiobolus coronatus (strain ATCC 28846 / CBS 209.66 / NRRL 28638) TaxID=796925 RepID=A0A137NT98_CONC2|nr:hypothetical protein CONCODRAFT_12252 [Conidiobolus coronatus NRRL 28638]|eukprot:KXN66003.1 hypothetical protein CONCODRAFT_12252 [Conidiobolus coronatus NRRL 28638]
MDAENIIKHTLLIAQSSCVVSQKTVNTWYKNFRLESCKTNSLKTTSSRKKFTDEYLIDLINKNPTLNMTELSRIAGATTKTISNRIKQIYSADELEKYCKRYNTKFTDEFLIELVNENPTLTMIELARLAGVSYSTISTRIKQINSTEERIKYVRKKYRPEEFGASNPKLTDEYIINLVNENPGLNLLLFTNEFLIDLINENPDLNLENLGRLADSSASAVKYRLKKINTNEKILKYTSKKPGSKLKFTDEFLAELIDENPNLNMTELARLASVSVSTISKRIKQANNSGEGVNYTIKNPQKDKLKQEKKSKFTNEFLIKLINENPSLNMTELAKLANVSVSAISKRIKQVNSSEKEVNYTTKLSQKDKPKQEKKSMTKLPS